MSGNESPFEQGRFRYTRLDVRAADEVEPSEEGDGPTDGQTDRPNRPGTRRGRGLDRAAGIALGFVLAIAIIVAFVFSGGDEAIDAPGLDLPEQARDSAPDERGESRETAGEDGSPAGGGARPNR